MLDEEFAVAQHIARSVREATHCLYRHGGHAVPQKCAFLLGYKASIKWLASEGIVPNECYGLVCTFDDE
ncbi:hypothetical protein HNP52_000780 [Sphingomonas kyeonggiensis]|uniref:Uncharacterized protein n=1 Tax=Sphingomonas kyeonggiensis TaxID=1268553 RepID=A0A7W7JYQ6_9SPHN|nr:hypothetical protein [Sphingomonas kyeonggiensis]MBB4837729.1 hypothetical protein [Sphingomonas kyeonggiensis]